jgi:hypothetical protein
MVKNLRICDLMTATPKKFADLRFEDYFLKFKNLLAHLRNLLICASG